MTELEIGQLWRHRKRGSSYRVIALNARIQCAQVNPAIEEMDCVVYQSVFHGTQNYYVRPVAEFLDGRFERVEES